MYNENNPSVFRQLQLSSPPTLAFEKRIVYTNNSFINMSDLNKQDLFLLFYNSAIYKESKRQLLRYSISIPLLLYVNSNDNNLGYLRDIDR